MKQLLFLVVASLALFACKKNSGPDSSQNSQLKVEVKENRKLSSGQIVSDPVTSSVFIMIWKADNRNLELRSDRMDGYAYDLTSQKSIKYDYAYTTASSNTTLVPGNYLIHVMLGTDAVGKRSAYSYITTEVKQGQTVSLTKSFTTRATSFTYEPWNAQE